MCDNEMTAAILVQTGQPLELGTVVLPDTLEPGQVLVRLFYSGICGAQLGEIAGAKGPDRFLPHLLGHEGSGEVLEVGPGVTTVAPGDHVVLHWRPSAGIQSATPRYTWEGARLNAGWVTTFNERAIVSENRVTAIPKAFPLDLAPLFGCALTTAFGVLNNDANVRPGESIVVLGTGGVGLSLVQAASLVSAHPIVAVDLHPAKLELAKRFGATHTIAAGDDLLERLRAAVGPQGADVVVDCTGLPSLIEAAYELAAPQGRIVCVGVPKKGQNVSIYTLPLHFGKHLTGSHGGEAVPDRDIPRLIRLWEAGKLDLSEIITDRYPLSRINTALDDLRSGAVAGRCLIEVSPPPTSRI